MWWCQLTNSHSLGLPQAFCAQWHSYRHIKDRKTDGESGSTGLGRFRYMTVSVQRSGQFWYMTTSVHMRSISVHVFFVVRLRYMQVPFWYIIKSISVHCNWTSVCLFCWRSANAGWMFSLLFLTSNYVQLKVLFHDIKNWSPPADQRANQRQ